jgi:hypothetical protein
LSNIKASETFRQESMAEHSACASSSASSGKRREAARARSVPYRQPFVITTIICAIHYLGLIASATSLILFFIHPTPLATHIFVATLGFSAVTWLIAFFKRRSTHCPLCKGTPLINSGALVHSKAFRLSPFNHGVSACLSIIANQKFCCMYCGNTYDLLKRPSHLRNRTPEEDLYYRQDPPP